MSIASIAFFILVVGSFGGLAVSLFAVYLYTQGWKETPSAPAKDSLTQASHPDTVDAESLPRAA